MLLIIIFFINSCVSKSKKKLQKAYYPSGKLMRSGWYINDSIPVDTIFKYYENGKLSSIAIYDTAGKLDGPLISYFKNGKKEQINTYIHGNLQGFSYIFNQSGNLDSKIFSLNGKQIGDYYGYDTNGILHNYAFYWDDTTYVNYIEYDSLGRIKEKLNNRPVLFNNTTTVRNNIVGNRTQKDCKIQLIISNPPNCRTRVNIDFISNNGVPIRNDSTVNVPFYLNHIVLPDSLKSIKFTAIQFDSSINKYYNYSVVTKL